MYLSSSNSTSEVETRTIPVNFLENFNAHLFQQEARADSSFMAQQNMWSAYNQTPGADSAFQAVTSQPAAAAHPPEIDYLFNPLSQQSEAVTVTIQNHGQAPKAVDIKPYNPEILTNLRESTDYDAMINMYDEISSSTSDIGKFLHLKIREIRDKMMSNRFNVTQITLPSGKYVPKIKYIITKRVRDNALYQIYTDSTNTVRTLQAIDTRHFYLQMEAAKVILNVINPRNKFLSGSKGNMVRKLQANQEFLPYNRQAFLETQQIMQNIQRDVAAAYEEKLQIKADKGDKAAAQALQEFQTLRSQQEMNYTTNPYQFGYLYADEPSSGKYEVDENEHMP
jgi:hypothetical protein